MKPSSLPLSLCAEQLRAHRRDRFLLSMLAPTSAREQLTALYALEMELEHVQAAVKEEMIGHIRYAWWQEAIDGIYEGKPARGHPVLEALKPMIEQGVLARSDLGGLVDSFRASLPQLPPHAAQQVDDVALKLLATLAPGRQKAWKKAQATAQRHRDRYGRSHAGMLAFKLLLCAYLP